MLTYENLTINKAKNMDIYIKLVNKWAIWLQND